MLEVKTFVAIFFTCFFCLALKPPAAIAVPPSAAINAITAMTVAGDRRGSSFSSMALLFGYGVPATVLQEVHAAGVNQRRQTAGDDDHRDKTDGEALDEQARHHRHQHG